MQPGEMQQLIRGDEGQSGVTDSQGGAVHGGLGRQSVDVLLNRSQLGCVAKCLESTTELEKCRVNAFSIRTPLVFILE